MKTYFIYLVPIVLASFLHYVRKSGKAGIIGKKIRNSDYLAWKDAVNEKQAELDELMTYKPRL